MFTKNFYILAGGVNILGSGASNVLKDSWYKLRNIAGNLMKSYSGYGGVGGGDVSNSFSVSAIQTPLKIEKSSLLAEQYWGSIYNCKYYSGVVFGNGTAPESIEDYTMSGELFTTYTHNLTENMVFDDNGAERVVVYTLTNTGSEPFTISEIGMIGYGYLSNQSNRAYESNFLWERTLLEVPITIAPGGIGQIAYTIRINYPV